MSRKMVQKNIWYDEKRKLYYVNLDYGKDKEGKRRRKTETFSKKKVVVEYKWYKLKVDSSYL